MTGLALLALASLFAAQCVWEDVHDPAPLPDPLPSGVKINLRPDGTGLNDRTL